MPGYDLSQFVADMGGSLGFLLGLSVLGLIGLFEKVLHASGVHLRAHCSWLFTSQSSAFQTMALVVKRPRFSVNSSCPSGERPESPASGASFSPELSSKGTGGSASTVMAEEKGMRH